MEARGRLLTAIPAEPVVPLQTVSAQPPWTLASCFGVIGREGGALHGTQRHDRCDGLARDRGNELEVAVVMQHR